jgi:protein phosphatase
MVAHVGDSRAYLLRGLTMIQLTQDHSWVEEQMRQGLLTPEEALVHPWRHMLTRALGIEAAVEPDLSTLSLQPNDRILLCTDGLTKMLDDHRIVDILLHAGRSADVACETLIAQANQRGGQDNTTVLIIQSQP